MRRLSVEVRFWSKVKKTEGCWLWVAKTKSLDGYGMFWATRNNLPPLTARDYGSESSFFKINRH